MRYRYDDGGLPLIDGKTGEKLATVSEPSAQRSFGADVLSRIQASEAGKLEILKEQIIFQIAQMLRTLQKKQGERNRFTVLPWWEIR